MSALRKHGIDVPGQVAVTGFDDIPLARHLRTSLTTSASRSSAGEHRLRRAVFDAQPRAVCAARDIVLPTELICRESCGCPPPADSADIGWYREI